MHYVTVITIIDRCNFGRVVERHAFLGEQPRQARLWGELRASVLLTEHAEPDVFDPHVDVDVVPLAEAAP